MKRLFRSETDRQVAGVCAGIAAYFGIDVALVRLGFVLGTILGGPGFMLYIILWLVLPEESQLLYRDEMKRKNDDITV
jgi:phage shock protein C